MARAAVPALCALLFCVRGAPCASDDCAAAARLVAEKRYAPAVRLLTGGSGPECPGELADAYTGLGDFKRAVSVLEAVASAGPGNAGITRRLARLNSWRGAYADSLRYYGLASAHAPGDCGLLVEKARVLAWASRGRDSDAAYAEAEKVCSGGWAGMEAAAKRSLRRGRLYTAEERYEQAIDLNGENEEALFDMAQLYSNSGLYSKAEAYYARLERLNPYNTALVRARSKNASWGRGRAEGGAAYWGAAGKDRMTDVRRTALYARGAAGIWPGFSVSAAGSYADYSFKSGSGLSERGAEAALAYAPSLFWGAGGSVSSFHAAGRPAGGPASLYVWGRISDISTLSLGFRRERMLNNRGNVLSGRGVSAVRSRIELQPAAGLPVGAELERGRVDGGNYYSQLGADAKAVRRYASGLLWAGAWWKRTAYEHGSLNYFAPPSYNAYALEAGWRRYFSRGGVYYGAPHCYAELKAAETFDNSPYLGFNPRAALYLETARHWTFKAGFSHTVSHYYRDNYWELSAVKSF